MRRIILIISTVIIASIVIIFSTAKSDTKNAILHNKDEQKSIPVEVAQLPLEKDVIPVELQCPDAQLSDSNTQIQLACDVTNNTGKNIISIVTAFSVTTEKNGVKSEDGWTLVSEALIHPDLRKIRKSSFIPPQGKSPVKNLPTTYEDEIVKVTARIDFVEFDDNSGMGPDQSGSRTIKKMRDGANKYKIWLLEKYYQSAKSFEKIRELLKDDKALIETLDLKNSEYQGANIYRKYLNRIYETDGVNGLNKNLITIK